MARDYGKVKAQFWESGSLQGRSVQAKFLALYLLTSPHTNAIGCFRLPIAYMGHDTGMDAATLEAALAELRLAGFSLPCERLPWIWIPNYLKHNAPENPNVWRRCVKELEAVPGEITARERIAAELFDIAAEERMSNDKNKGRVSEDERTRLKRFENGCETVGDAQTPLPYPIPVPNPEPILANSLASQAKPPTPKRERRSLSSIPEDCPNEESRTAAVAFWRDRGREDLCERLDDEAQAFRDHHQSRASRMADWPAAWRTWFGKTPAFKAAPRGGSQFPTAKILKVV